VKVERAIALLVALVTPAGMVLVLVALALS
jgi:hypothetical protein